MPQSSLTHEQILRLRQAVIAAGIAQSRDVLLTGISPEVVASLSYARNAGDQILSDISELNAIGILTDGKIPIKVWLINALAAAAPTRYSDVFRGALASLGHEATPSAHGTSPLPTAPVKPSWRSPRAIVRAATQTAPVVKYTMVLAVVALLVIARYFPKAGQKVSAAAVVVTLVSGTTIVGAVAQHRRSLRVGAVALAWFSMVLLVSGLGIFTTIVWYHIPTNPQCLFYGDYCAPEKQASMTGTPRGTLRQLDTERGSYGGRSRGASERPITGANVILAGTRCVTRTTELGVFDFSSCEDEGMKRIFGEPRIHIVFQPTTVDNSDWWDCQDIEIDPPPLMSNVRVNPENCQVLKDAYLVGGVAKGCSM